MTTEGGKGGQEGKRRWLRVFGLRITFVFMGLLCGMNSARASAANVRTLEAVGTVSVDPDAREAAAPRKDAIRRGLREAVERVANEFLSEQAQREAALAAAVVGGAASGSETSAGRTRDDPRSADLPIGPIAGEDSPEQTEGPDWVAVLGKKMLPYTSRFRVLEDRGRRPALFSEDPNVVEEYVVIVEVEVDLDRVRERLVRAGLLAPTSDESSSMEIRLEVEGLTRYPGYQALEDLLLGQSEVSAISPVELSHGSAIFRLETEFSVSELLQRLLSESGNELRITPLEIRDGLLKIAVIWTPEAPGTMSSAEHQRSPEQHDAWDVQGRGLDLIGDGGVSENPSRREIQLRTSPD